MAALKPLSPFPDPNPTSVGGDRLSTLWARWFEQLRFTLNTLISSWNGSFHYYGAFHYDNTTVLTAAMTNVSTTPIQVVSTVGFPSAGALAIEDEIVSYTGTTLTTFTGITRGAYGSSNSAHAIGTPVGGAQGTSAATRTLLKINATDISNGVTLSATTSEVTIHNDGAYNMMFSVQFANPGAAPDNVTVWFVVDGTDVPFSASVAAVPAKHADIPGSSILAVNLFYTFVANQKVQLYWTTDSGNSSIVTYPGSASPQHPESPAVIFTVNTL